MYHGNGELIGSDNDANIVLCREYIFDRIGNRTLSLTGRSTSTAVFDLSSSSVAYYEYEPLDNLTNSVGAYVGDAVFGLSTKYRDKETSQLYYGFRYYSPITRCWLSRDRIEGPGDYNLYVFLNSGTSGWVFMGLTAGAQFLNNELDENAYNHYNARIFTLGRVKSLTLINVRFFNQADEGDCLILLHLNSIDDMEDFSIVTSFKNLGELGFEINGAVESTDAKIWDFKGTIKPKDEDFNFKPLFKIQGFGGTIVNTIFNLFEKSTPADGFEIRFKGSVNHDHSGLCE